MKFALSLISALALPLAALAAEPDMPLLYENDFEDGIEGLSMTDPDAWKHETVDGNGVLALTAASDYQPPVRSPLNIAWINDLVVTDFVLEADLEQTGREYGHRDLCLFYGIQGPQYFYYTHLATEADEHANSIFLVNNAARVSIAQERTDGTKWTEGFHKVRIVRDAESGLIEVYFDDMENPVMKTVDKTFTYGQLGFGSFDDVGRFDNVKVWGKRATIEGSESKSSLDPRNVE